MSALGALLGAMFAAGVALVITGLGSQPGHRLPGHNRRRGPEAIARSPSALPALLAVSFAALVGLLTHWPVGAVAAGLAGWFTPKMLGSSRRGRALQTARIEALATWAELLRDGFDAGSFLESTIRSTEVTAPVAISAEVGRLCQRMRRARPRSTDLALRGFAADLADPTADMIITALLLAANGAATNLADLLSTLAAAAREEATMRLRVEAKRAEILLQRRVIIGVIALFVTYLLTFQRGYLHPFGSADGQIVLAAVAALFIVSLWLMDRFTRFVRVERMLRPEEA